MMQLGYTPPAELGRVSMRALIVGVVFSLLLIIGAFIDRKSFFSAYLVGFIFWTGISLGSLALLMLQHSTGGAWGLVIRRVLEAATRTLPLMIILFLPIVHISVLQRMRKHGSVALMLEFWARPANNKHGYSWYYHNLAKLDRNNLSVADRLLRT